MPSPVMAGSARRYGTPLLWRRKVLASCGFIALLSQTAGGVAAELRELPPLLRTISDEVGVVSVAEGTALSRQIGRIEDEHGIKIILVIVETVEPEDIDDYTRRLLARWRSRTSALDKGSYVSVVVAVKDRVLRITPGAKTTEMVYELERGGALNSVPLLLREARYFQALELIVEELGRTAVYSR